MGVDQIVLKDTLNECLPYLDYVPLKKKIEKILEDLRICVDDDIIIND